MRGRGGGVRGRGGFRGGYGGPGGFIMPGFRGGYRGGGGRGGFLPFGGRGAARAVRPAPAGSRVYIGNLAWTVQWQVRGRGALLLLDRQTD